MYCAPCSSNQIKRNRILFDYSINYIFPQYTLPQNNFFTGVTTRVTRSF
jgi:hypothetical protein